MLPFVSANNNSWFSPNWWHVNSTFRNMLTDTNGNVFNTYFTCCLNVCLLPVHYPPFKLTKWTKHNVNSKITLMILKLLLYCVQYVSQKCEYFPLHPFHWLLSGSRRLRAGSTLDLRQSQQADGDPTRSRMLCTRDIKITVLFYLVQTSAKQAGTNLMGSIHNSHTCNKNICLTGFKKLVFKPFVSL